MNYLREGFLTQGGLMDKASKRYGFVGIILSDRGQAPAVQRILSEYGHLVCGRMGLPHLENDTLSVITLIVRADTDELGALTGKLGRISGVSVKSALSK